MNGSFFPVLVLCSFVTTRAGTCDPGLLMKCDADTMSCVQGSGGDKTKMCSCATTSLSCIQKVMDDPDCSALRASMGQMIAAAKQSFEAQGCDTSLAVAAKGNASSSTSGSFFPVPAPAPAPAPAIAQASFSCSSSWPISAFSSSWATYCSKSDPKAWAMTPSCNAAWGRWGGSTVESVKTSALASCANHGSGCQIFDTNGAKCQVQVPEPAPAPSIGKWMTGAYGDCSGRCGEVGTMSRDVSCSLGPGKCVGQEPVSKIRCELENTDACESSIPFEILLLLVVGSCIIVGAISILFSVPAMICVREEPKKNGWKDEGVHDVPAVGPTPYKVHRPQPARSMGADGKIHVIWEPCMFATEAHFQKHDEQREHEKSITFRPGLLDLSFDVGGIVTGAPRESQAGAAGVQTGWYIIKVMDTACEGGSKKTIENLFKKAKSLGADYTVTFLMVKQEGALNEAASESPTSALGAAQIEMGLAPIGEDNEPGKALLALTDGVVSSIYDVERADGITHEQAIAIHDEHYVNLKGAHGGVVWSDTQKVVWEADFDQVLMHSTAESITTLSPRDGLASGQLKFFCEEGSEMEYFSATHGRWLPGVVHIAVKQVPSSALLSDDIIMYNIVIDGNRTQERQHVPLKSLRKPLFDTELVEVTSESQRSKWVPGMIYGRQSTMPAWSGYTVVLSEAGEENGANILENVPAANIRRRFPAGVPISVYKGCTIGWCDAVVHSSARADGCKAKPVPGMSGPNKSPSSRSKKANKSPWVLVPVQTDDEGHCEMVPSHLIRNRGQVIRHERAGYAL